MVQGRLLTAHPGGVNGDGGAPRGDSSLRQGAGQRLLGSPILKRRRRRYREEIGEKSSGVEGFSSWRIYRRRGAARGATRGLGAPWARPHPRAHHQGAWGLGGG